MRYRFGMGDDLIKSDRTQEPSTSSTSCICNLNDVLVNKHFFSLLHPPVQEVFLTLYMNKFHFVCIL